DGKNVFGRITKSQLLDGTIVAADKIKRRHDYAELNQIDDEELKRRSIKRIVPKPACHSIDCKPAHYIQKKILQCRRPFVGEKMGPETDSPLVARCGPGLGHRC